MAHRKTIWGFFLDKISDKHRCFLDQTFADLIDILTRCSINSDFRPFHDFLQQINCANQLSFLSELADNNSDYAHIDYLRRTFLVESFALLGDFAGMLNAQRTLINRGSRIVAEHYGLYRRVVPNIVATGQEIYYCVVSKLWLIRTKRKDLKQAVLEKFSKVVLEQAFNDDHSFFEDFASRHEKATRSSLEECGFASLYLRSLLKQD